MRMRYLRTIILTIMGLISLIAGVGITIQGLGEKKLTGIVLDVNNQVAELRDGQIYIKHSLSEFTYIAKINATNHVLVLVSNVPRVPVTVAEVYAICNGNATPVKPLSDHTVIGSGICEIYVKTSMPLTIRVELT